MAFTIYKATPEDIPGIISVWRNAFTGPRLTDAFPDTPATTDWLNKAYTTSIVDSSKYVTLMVMKDENGKVAAYSVWVLEQGGPSGPSNWKERWGEPGEGVDKDKVEAFFAPMSRQHASVMGNRRHYFLEVLATHSDHRRKGLGARLLDWGDEAADKEGLESYLDASPDGKPLYEKHGYAHQKEKQDPEATAVAMMRSTKHAA